MMQALLLILFIAMCASAVAMADRINQFHVDRWRGFVVFLMRGVAVGSFAIASSMAGVSGVTWLPVVPGLMLILPLGNRPVVIASGLCFAAYAIAIFMVRDTPGVASTSLVLAALGSVITLISQLPRRFAVAS